MPDEACLTHIVSLEGIPQSLLALRNTRQYFSTMFVEALFNSKIKKKKHKDGKNGALNTLKGTFVCSTGAEKRKQNVSLLDLS